MSWKEPEEETPWRGACDNCGVDADRYYSPRGWVCDICMTAAVGDLADVISTEDRVREQRLARRTGAAHEPERSGRRVGTSYRPHDWLDTKTNLPKHGIQAKAVGFECRWLHCAEDNSPLLYDTPEERDAKLRDLRREEGEKRRASKPSPSPS